MTLQALPGDLDRAARRIGALRDDLVEQQLALASDVDRLLGSGWSGGAAGQFRTAWAQWCRGMGEVLRGIRHEGEAIGLARVELAGVDAERAASSRRLQERLEAP